jgi:hypothetical protein
VFEALVVHPDKSMYYSHAVLNRLPPLSGLQAGSFTAKNKKEWD